MQYPVFLADITHLHIRNSRNGHALRNNFRVFDKIAVYNALVTETMLVLYLIIPLH